ncbi:hypothetical protein ACLB2K_074604 [Fragaria x ananassa]
MVEDVMIFVHNRPALQLGSTEAPFSSRFALPKRKRGGSAGKREETRFRENEILEARRKRSFLYQKRHDDYRKRGQICLFLNLLLPQKIYILGSGQQHQFFRFAHRHKFFSFSLLQASAVHIVALSSQPERARRRRREGLNIELWSLLRNSTLVRAEVLTLKDRRRYSRMSQPPTAPSSHGSAGSVNAGENFEVGDVDDKAPLWIFTNKVEKMPGGGTWRYYSPEWLGEDSTRKAPHQDIEVTRERKHCILKYYENADERREVNVEFSNFSMCMDDFCNVDAMHDRFILPPLTWWAVHGASALRLQALAFKLLGQPSSSSCCERNWSTYKFIHSATRNKITPQRAEDLVYVHTNLRLLSRRSHSYKEGPSQMWDVGGDQFDSLDETNLGRLEFEDLSLDEPALENDIFGNAQENENEVLDV